MDEPETFSVGVTLRSRALAVADLESMLPAFDEHWDDPSLRELHPRLRSGTAGQHGALLHAHLADDSMANAAENVLAAARLLQSPAVQQLSELDHDLEIEVHAQHDFPDRGRLEPLHLSREAVSALASLRDSSLDLDRYDGRGYRILELLQPLIRPGWADRYRTHAALHLSGEGDESMTLRTGWFRDLDDDPHEGALIKMLTEWRAGDGAFTVREARCVLEQVVYVPGNQGLGATIGAELIRMLAELNSDLTLVVSRRFAVNLRRRRRG